MATITSVGSGNWSTAGTWDSGVPADNDTVVIAAGHTVTFDADTSGFANGIAGITITSHATTPGMLRAKYDADGTYYLKLKTGTTIAGTNAAAKGRLLANSDGVWGNTGALAYGRKFIIEMGLTGKIVGSYLDIALYGYEPAVKSATVYGTVQTVSSINTETGVITLGGAHGWNWGEPVMVVSSGDYPGGLAPNTVYYVNNPSGADLQLDAYDGASYPISITSSGSGTISIFSGHTNTSTATVNVLEDLTAVTGWITTDGHDFAVLVNANSPSTYDQQRLQLTTINASSLVLSANVDSAQYPFAKVWLVSRNVSIRSACTTAVAIVGLLTSGSVLQCEIRATAGSGTTFYGNGISGGAYTMSGTVSGCTNGVNAGSGSLISGVVVGCSVGVSEATAVSVSGTISGCSTGVSGGNDVTVSGTISGCSTGVSAGKGHTVSGTISGCSNGVSAGRNHTVSGTVSGCNVGIVDSLDMVISGIVSNCYYLVTSGSGWLHGAVLSGGNRAMYPDGGYWQGWGATITSETQCTQYKHSQNKSSESRNSAVAILDFSGVAEALGFWTLGGYTKSATYAEGTHGTPPVALALVHETTFEDNDRITWAEYSIWGVSGQQVSVTFYGKLTAHAAFTTLPSIGIYDPTKGWQDGDEDLDVETMAASTNWQTLTVTYTPTRDRELRVRVQGIGGNAGGTGTEQLYWYAEITPSPAGSGGGGFPILGGSVVR